MSEDCSMHVSLALCRCYCDGQLRVIPCSWCEMDVAVSLSTHPFVFSLLPHRGVVSVSPPHRGVVSVSPPHINTPPPPPTHTQISEDVFSGRHPVANVHDGVGMAALMAQVSQIGMFLCFSGMQYPGGRCDPSPVNCMTMQPSLYCPLPIPPPHTPCTPTHPTSTHPTPTHPTSTHPTPTHPTSTYPTFTPHLSPTHRLSMVTAVLCKIMSWWQEKHFRDSVPESSRTLHWSMTRRRCPTSP